MPQRLDPAELLRSSRATDRYVGVALEIPEPFRTQLRDIRSATGDPLAAISSPHITLVPPTQVSSQEAAQLSQHLEQVAQAHQEFEMVLSGVDSFRPLSPVVFAAVRTGGHECSALEQDVRRGPLAVETLFDYHPHVTLAQGLSQQELDRAMVQYQDLQMRFTVSSFGHYVWSGSSWQLRTRYHLPARW